MEVEFSGTVDGIWARNKWSALRQYFVLGGYINFTDTDLCKDGRLLRILAIKDYINRPHAPELTLSNSTVSQSVSSELKKIAQNQQWQNQQYADAIQFAKRNFRDAEETQKKLEEAYLSDIAFLSENVTENIQNIVNNIDATQTHFTESVNPVTIQTMSMLIGDKNLQLQFGHAETDGSKRVAEWKRYTYEPRWDGGVFHCPDTLTIAGEDPLAAHVRHDYWTINKNINAVTADEVADHPYWIVSEATLSSDGNGQNLDPVKAYFLYLVAPMAAASGDSTGDGWGYLKHSATWSLYEETQATENSDGNFYFLIGILNAEFNGTRSYVDIYSSVEITGGQIRADMLVSQDGGTYFDIVNNIIQGNINIIDGAVTKELILGDNKAANFGGFSGDKIYDEVDGSDDGIYYGRLVRFWIGNKAIITEKDENAYVSGQSGRVKSKWLRNASIVLYADGSWRVGGLRYAAVDGGDHDQVVRLLKDMDTVRTITTRGTIKGTGTINMQRGESGNRGWVSSENYVAAENYMKAGFLAGEIVPDKYINTWKCGKTYQFLQGYVPFLLWNGRVNFDASGSLEGGGDSLCTNVPEYRAELTNLELCDYYWAAPNKYPDNITPRNTVDTLKAQQKYYNRTYFSVHVNKERDGVLWVNLHPHIAPQNYFVTFQGYGNGEYKPYIQGGGANSAPAYCTLVQKNFNYFVVEVADDSTLNDFSFWMQIWGYGSFTNPDI